MPTTKKAYVSTSIKCGSKRSNQTKQSMVLTTWKYKPSFLWIQYWFYVQTKSMCSRFVNHEEVSVLGVSSFQ